jgi:hypothetical protein
MSAVVVALHYTTSKSAMYSQSVEEQFLDFAVQQVESRDCTGKWQGAGFHNGVWYLCVMVKNNIHTKRPQ